MSYKHLSLDERNVIYRMSFLGNSEAQIARCLGRNPSTISREIRRNASCTGRYVPQTAQVKAGARCRTHVRRPKTGNTKLMRYVERRLRRHWAPEQIAGRLRKIGSRKMPGLAISHQTIYRWIWADPERAERLKPYLRVACKARRKPYGKPSKRGQILGRVSIDERPQAANDRQRLGDWEGDTVVGKGRSAYVVSCVDRTSRFLVARKQKSCSASKIGQNRK